MTAPESAGPINILKAIENNIEKAIDDKTNEVKLLINRLRLANLELAQLQTYKDLKDAQATTSSSE